MKKTILLVMLAFIGLSTANAQVGIGTTNPDTSAALDVESTNKGFLPPRLTIAQRDAITSPAEGLTIYNTDNKCLETYNGTDWLSICDGSVVTSPPSCKDNTTTITDVSGANGKMWMDRNLGATQVATQPRSDFANDAAYIASQENSFGDLYQWGRCADGHEKRAAGTYDADQSGNTKATTAAPFTGAPWDGLFIMVNAGRGAVDWLATSDNTLWQGEGGTNNPCPAGYRIPTSAEFDTERLSWTSQDPDGAMGSTLKLPLAGFSDNRNTNPSSRVQSTGIRGYYSTSTTTAPDPNTGTDIETLLIKTDGTPDATIEGVSRAGGQSVRCVKD